MIYERDRLLMLNMLSRNAVIRENYVNAWCTNSECCIGGRNKRNNEAKSSDSSLDSVTQVTLQEHRTRPWRLSTDVPRALLDTVIAGIGYLL